MRSRGIITLAYGRPRYVEMAKSLARSLILHDPTLMRAIITDSADPELGDLFTYRIDLRPEYGSVSRQMLHLDRYTPFEETLFIDCDSLAVHPLDNFWTAFQSVPFGVCGTRTLSATDTDTDPALDVPFLLNHFHLTTLPRFDGASYYFKRTPEAAALFTTARDLLLHAPELRFTHFQRDGLDTGPSDEAIYSVAMAIHGLTVTDMGHGGMWPAIDANIRLALDIPHGICTFVKPGHLFVPDILHLAHFTESLFYLRECARLKHLLNGRTDLTTAEELQLISTASVLWLRRKARSLRQHLRQLLHIVPTPNRRTSYGTSRNAIRLRVSTEHPHRA